MVEALQGPLSLPEAGNAYCFPFETFETLIREALRPEGAFLGDVLYQRQDSLLKLAGHAERTKVIRARVETTGSVQSASCVIREFPRLVRCDLPSA